MSRPARTFARMRSLWASRHLPPWIAGQVWELELTLPRRHDQGGWSYPNSSLSPLLLGDIEPSELGVDERSAATPEAALSDSREARELALSAALPLWLALWLLRAPRQQRAAINALRWFATGQLIQGKVAPITDALEKALSIAKWALPRCWERAYLLVPPGGAEAVNDASCEALETALEDDPLPDQPLLVLAAQRDDEGRRVLEVSARPPGAGRSVAPGVSGRCEVVLVEVDDTEDAIKALLQLAGCAPARPLRRRLLYGGAALALGALALCFQGPLAEPPTGGSPGEPAASPPTSEPPSTGAPAALPAPSPSSPSPSSPSPPAPAVLAVATPAALSPPRPEVSGSRCLDGVETPLCTLLLSTVPADNDLSLLFSNLPPPSGEGRYTTLGDLTITAEGAAGPCLVSPYLRGEFPKNMLYQHLKSTIERCIKQM